MKITTILFLLLFVIPFMASGQTPKDYFNNEVKNGQGATTNKIIKYLEHNSIDSALNYFSKGTDKFLLIKASIEIRKIYQKTNGGYVIVFDEGYNIFRYRYTNKGIYFLIDFYFNEGDANSKVIKVIIKDKATLDKEDKENDDDDDVPPPPPKKR